MDSVWQVVLVLATVLALALFMPELVFDCHGRPLAEQSAAAACLKSGIFPAQVQFQAGVYIDQDGDRVGEYGFLSELAGRRASRAAVRFVQGPLTTGDVASGYRYAIWLPDGAGGALGEPATAGPRPVLATAATAQARRFRAYAWPVGADPSNRMFCIDESGVLRAADWQGAPPGWDAVTGGKGWDAAPAWPQFAR